MKKGCLLGLLLFAVLTGLYYLAFHGRFSPPGDWIGALVGGFFLLVAVDGLRGILTELRNRARLDRALAGEPFVDGQPVAAIGPLMALGQPIAAPFSQKPCVAYSYQVSHKEKGPTLNDDDLVIKDFTGVTLMPCVVRTPRGNVRILGLPGLQGFSVTSLTGGTVRDRAKAYLGSASFEELGRLDAGHSNVSTDIGPTNLGPQNMGSVVRDLEAGTDGALRKDWWAAGDEFRLADFRLDPRPYTLKEQIVRDGETVTVFGLYQAAQRGIVPDGEGVKLIRGDGRQAGKSFQGNLGKSLAAGVVMFLFLHLVLFLVLSLREHLIHGEEREARNDALLEALASGDVNDVTARLDEGGGADIRDSDGSPSLMQTQDPRVTRRLIAAGADVDARNRAGSTALIEATKIGSLEITRQLIQAGADLELRDTVEKRTALEWALWYKYESLVKALRAAGAKEPVDPRR
jgi:hypothetical protein